MENTNMQPTRTQAERSTNKARIVSSDPEPQGPAAEHSLIQWPSWEALRQVSEQLACVQRAGIRSETNGDHFTSGDVAYQLQEIIRSTAALLRRSERNDS